MADERNRTIPELIADRDLLTTAIERGVREELLSQARAGNSVPISRDGRVIWLSPAEVFEHLGYVHPVDTRAS